MIYFDIQIIPINLCIEFSYSIEIQHIFGFLNINSPEINLYYRRFVILFHLKNKITSDGKEKCRQMTKRIQKHLLIKNMKRMLTTS